MIKRIYCLCLFFLLAVTQLHSQEELSKDKRTLLHNNPGLKKPSYSSRMQKTGELLVEAKQSIETRGFQVLGPAPKLISLHKDSFEVENEIIRIGVSFDLRAHGVTPVNREALQQSNLVQADMDTIMTDGFEGEFPSTTWQLCGNPTWGKTNYMRHNGNYSVWCAKDGTNGAQPGQNYPNNCKSIMVYGPFDPTQLPAAGIGFWFWLNTEVGYDWFSWSVSLDGSAFYGYAMSGYSSGWLHDGLALNDVPELGDISENDSVWIAFSFSSDKENTGLGVFLDDVAISKPYGRLVSGDVSGRWTIQESPYVVIDDIKIPAGSSLEIDPGVQVNFYGHYGFLVNGALVAKGTEKDSIVFAPYTPTIGWNGIHFERADNTSQLSYCVIKYCKITTSEFDRQGGAVYFNYSNPCIRNSTISHNSVTGGSVSGAGIYCYYSNPIIDHNVIADNLAMSSSSDEKVYGSGICCEYSSPTISYNTISNNSAVAMHDDVEGSGIFCFQGSPTISYNTITNNSAVAYFCVYGCGISCSSSNSIISNNTISDNEIISEYPYSGGGGI